jgi:hypothetical protein
MHGFVMYFLVSLFFSAMLPVYPLLVHSLLSKNNQSDAIRYNPELHAIKDSAEFPDFFIIGMQKCSTSSLYGVFRRYHPEICRSVTKEVQYFDQESNWDQGAAFYGSNFSSSNCKMKLKKANFIDATPDYFYNPLVPARMYESFTASARQRKKFILVLRDPVQREYSWYNHLSRNCVQFMRAYMLQHESMETEVEAQKALWNTSELFAGDHCPPLRHSPRASSARRGHELAAITNFTEYWQAGSIALSNSEYVTHLHTWLKYFDRKQFFVVNMATLLVNTTDTVQRMARFLGIAPFPQSAYRNGEIRYPHDNLPRVETTFDCAVRNALYPHYQPYNQRLYEFLADRSAAKVTHEPPFSEFATKPCAPGQLF